MEKQKEYNLRYLLAKVPYYMRKSVGQAPTAGEQKHQKPCRTSSDIGELEKHLYFILHYYSQLHISAPSIGVGLDYMYNIYYTLTRTHTHTHTYIYMYTLLIYLHYDIYDWLKVHVLI
jgi:hypothetical protein